MAWEVVVPADAEDEAAAALHELGTHGIEVRSQGADALLIAYFEDRPGLEGALRAAVHPAALRRADVPEVDWVARFREGFRRFQVAGLTLAPPWDLPPAPTERLLVVEPGPAFGTGTHETTRLCLEAVTRLAAAGAPSLGRVLDVGTGTGILALAALRCGARQAVGVDLDGEALAWARHHAALNRLPLRLVRGDAGLALRPDTFDLVLANLSAPLLRAHAAGLERLARPGGTLVLSGFLLGDLEEVAGSYASMRRRLVLRHGDWGALVMERAA